MLVLPRHPILEGMGGDWPLLLGVNEVTLKSRPGVELLARVPDAQGGHPLLAAGTLRPRPHARLDLRHRPALAARSPSPTGPATPASGASA